jgi:DNA invertase Pin-like site-specific DNA recombinase
MYAPARAETVRCAIYTRKSTVDGLDMAFNSLDAQREAGEAFVLSRKQEGWTCLPDRYDDGGYSGGNIERPALKRLMADIEAGGIDAVVCYKVDRLSRSLLDLSRLIEVFDRRRVMFVSVTQPINTADSGGRLMLNVLLSFAQFEREMIADRTRDKMSAARKKGKWTGGFPVLCYDVHPGGGQLVVNEEEAETVRQIFTLYLDLRSLQRLARELTVPAGGPSPGPQRGGRSARACRSRSPTCPGCSEIPCASAGCPTMGKSMRRAPRDRPCGPLTASKPCSPRTMSAVGRKPKTATGISCAACCTARPVVAPCRRA